jgi:copper chaperone
MTNLSIPDMSCGHCKAAIEAAILKLDPSAHVVIDMPNRRASITSSQPDAALIKALDSVGFPARPA